MCAFPRAVVVERAQATAIPPPDGDTVGLRTLEMAPRKSPRDARCPHCGRHFTKGGLKQHLRHVKCSPTSTATPRKFERVRCKHCGKSFHSTNSLRVHVSTVHPEEYARSPGLMKHHRAPYHKKRRSSDRSGCGPDQGSPAQASMRAAERAPTRADGHPDSIRQPSGGDRRAGQHRDAKRRAQREPTWQKEMKKKMAEAAGGKPSSTLADRRDSRG